MIQYLIIAVYVSLWQVVFAAGLALLVALTSPLIKRFVKRHKEVDDDEQRDS